MTLDSAKLVKVGDTGAVQAIGWTNDDFNVETPNRRRHRRHNQRIEELCDRITGENDDWADLVQLR